MTPIVLIILASAVGSVLTHLSIANFVEARRLREIVAGRVKPPSVEEIRAHALAHPWGGDPSSGRWLVRAPNSPSGSECSAVVILRILPDGRVVCGLPKGVWVELPENPTGKHDPDSRYWPLAADGSPCEITPALETTR